MKTHAQNHAASSNAPSAGYIIGLGGNPNVGKSTVFNALTGMHQHTGNWPGKTVAGARGICKHRGESYTLVDIPGTYSLMANSPEEEVARDYICFGDADALILVVDATCLLRNLGFVIQVLEAVNSAVLCVNLMDEAAKKGIRVDLAALSKALGIPVIGATARSGKGVKDVMDAAARAAKGEKGPYCNVPYPSAVEAAVSELLPHVSALCPQVSSRFVALRLLEGDQTFIERMEQHYGFSAAALAAHIERARGALVAGGMGPEQLQDAVTAGVSKLAHRVFAAAVTEPGHCHQRDRRLDALLTHPVYGVGVMLLLLFCIFYLTMEGANYPSAWLSRVLSSLGSTLSGMAASWGAPSWLCGLLFDGIYRTLSWVVSVMLPPMAIFFPLFTLLEDSGYLPRIAFNLDGVFHRAGAHGKQALTMAMGFGCNACAVMGCRIIDSPRERLIAILTNNFVPCNGRFPTLIAIITMFFAGSGGQMASALMLMGVILFGILMTFAVSSLLSRTVLKGVPSAFTLELPPYRRPQVVKVIIRSVFDRTLFVLGRAAAVAAPAGALIWLLSNTMVGGSSVLVHLTRLLHPLGSLMGMDGTILLAFLLGLPAGEIVMPILLMGYLDAGTLIEASSLGALHGVLTANGWTVITAICTMVFSLCHFPCGTTLWTIYRETGSAKWTLLSAILPTLMGMVLCMTIAFVGRLLL